jgi:hypothetical protein
MQRWNAWRTGFFVVKCFLDILAAALVSLDAE